MAHTPGQWWIDEDGDCLCICEGEVNEYGEREEVAILHCNRPSLRATQPANARLIAAAPEMLKQLRAVRDDIGALACDTNGWREWDATTVDELLGSRLVRLDDLIAKAEGGK